MSLVGFKAINHPRYRGSRPDVDDRALPPEDFAKLQLRFGFTIDVCASMENAKLPRYVTAKQDGLKTNWGGERVYCNPPYSKIAPWMAKAWQETTCPLAVMLLPANRTEQGFWQDFVEPFRDRAGSPLRVEFLTGRFRFLKSGQASIRPNERPPFGCCLCIWERALPAALGNPMGI